MTRDYGERVKPKSVFKIRGFQIGLVLAVLALGVVIGSSWLRKRSLAIETAAKWTIEGPACPEVADRAALPSRPPANRSHKYGDVLFVRAAGHTSCAMVVYDGGKGSGSFPVCQFSSPAALIVTAEDKTTYFAPPLGARATVSVPHGEPRCVLAAPAWPPLEMGSGG